MVPGTAYDNSFKPCNTFGRDLKYIFCRRRKPSSITGHNHVCLLVNTDYINYTRIEGVQVFGRAVTSEQEPELLQEALEFCPDLHAVRSQKDSIKAIKIIPDEIVYLNSRETGDRTKQILTSGQIVRHKAQSAGELAFR